MAKSHSNTEEFDLIPHIDPPTYSSENTHSLASTCLRAKKDWRLFGFHLKFEGLNVPELSTGRMDPRVGSGRVGSGHEFAGFWRLGSGRVSTSDF